jgi:hypothetical protein
MDQDGNIARRPRRGIQSNTDRAAFNYIKSLPGYRNAVITEGYLRSEQSFQATKELTFPILENAGTQSATERRLNISDDFLVTHVGVGIIPAVTTTGGGDPAILNLETYPNPVSLGAGGADDLNYARAFYNGSMSIRKDSTVYFEALDLHRFMRVGAAQEGLNVSTAASNNAYGASSWGPNSGYMATTPFILFEGTSKNTVKIDIPIISTGTDFEAFAVVLFRGLLIQQGRTS